MKYHEKIVDKPTISTIKYPLFRPQDVLLLDSNDEKLCLSKSYNRRKVRIRNDKRRSNKVV